jgi:3'-phosphoadenosine 5'-phosphosulfate (PAPS) 3'-phosphatase
VVFVGGVDDFAMHISIIYEGVPLVITRLYPPQANYEA